MSAAPQANYRPVHETAVDEFVTADQAYRDAEQRFLSGDFLPELITAGASLEGLREGFVAVHRRLRQLLEERNVKLTSAQAALRHAVQLQIPKKPQPGAGEVMIKYGPFTAKSYVLRQFDTELLYDLCGAKGVLADLNDLEFLDGKGKKKQVCEWKVNFAAASKFLEDKGLGGVVQTAYQPRVESPRVTGPKPLSFLGLDAPNPDSEE